MIVSCESSSKSVIKYFLMGRKKKSGRDGFVVYMGNDVLGVK